MLSTILIPLFAWWTYYSDLILLEHYGYNIDGMSETERYGKVASENIITVKELEISIMGIGWTLKAVFGYILYLPYLLICYMFRGFFEL